MTILARPWAAASAARLLQGVARVASRRTGHAAGERLPEYPRHVDQIAVPTSWGRTRVALYHPPSGEPLPPVHINLHGGGFVLPMVELDDPLCRALAAEAAVVVLNVDYVVAPQHPYPEPPHHVYEVVEWVAHNGREHGWDGRRLTVGGQSAGGALAAAASRLVLERSGPAIALQVLHYAPLDLSVPASSKHTVLGKPKLRPWMGDVFDGSYVSDPHMRTDRLVSPAGPADQADLTGIAPAVVIAAEHDILCDEAQRYADRLAAVDALIEHHVVPGADHGYDLDDDDLARASCRRIAGHLRRAALNPPSAL